MSHSSVICYSRLLWFSCFSVDWFCFLSLLADWVSWIFFLEIFFFFYHIPSYFSLLIFYPFSKNYLPCLRCSKPSPRQGWVAIIEWDHLYDSSRRRNARGDDWIPSSRWLSYGLKRESDNASQWWTKSGFQLREWQGGFFQSRQQRKSLVQLL